MIATKIGHDERYVWNRLRLLELIPEVQRCCAPASSASSTRRSSRS
jgi:hypothetical protein